MSDPNARRNEKLRARSGDARRVDETLREDEARREDEDEALPENEDEPLPDDEARASSLDISREELSELAARAVEIVAQYFDEVAELPVFPEVSGEELARRFRTPPPLEGEPLERVLEDCRAVFAGSRHNASPRFFGYIASPSTPVGAYANLLASTLNQNVTAWRSAPAATEIERTVTRWLGSMIGYADDCGGLLTSGGSMANLNALYVAHRDRLRADAPSQKGLQQASAPATLYVSDQAHLSIAKAADVLGLGREQVRVVGTDESFRMDVRRLRERIDADLERGLRPFCVVASAGTTSTGAVDALSEIARVAQEHALWYHIDGAYGALGALDDTKRHLFDGLERADSVSLDPHKWLYAPVDCGCLLLREPERARMAFAGHEQEYIKVYAEQEDEAFAFWDYGVELSRPFRALKVWMMLRAYGVRRISAAIAEDNALAAYLAARVEASADLELLAPVTLGICCFRYVPPRLARALETAADETERASLDARLDDLNTRIMRAVQRGGRAYFSNATLGGRFALRVSITNFRTTRRDLDITLAAVRDAARELSEEKEN